MALNTMESLIEALVTPLSDEPFIIKYQFLSSTYLKARLEQVMNLLDGKHVKMVLATIRDILHEVYYARSFEREDFAKQVESSLEQVVHMIFAQRPRRDCQALLAPLLEGN